MLVCMHLLDRTEAAIVRIKQKLLTSMKKLFCVSLFQLLFSDWQQVGETERSQTIALKSHS